MCHSNRLFGLIVTEGRKGRKGKTEKEGTRLSFPPFSSLGHDYPLVETVYPVPIFKVLKKLGEEPMILGELGH
jgi:hypothetical protein